jgi:hypothetical protein
MQGLAANKIYHAIALAADICQRASTVPADMHVSPCRISFWKP